MAASKMRKGLKIVMGMVILFINTPIWFYMWYSVLKSTNQDRLIWFLFWMYVPLTIFSAMMSVILDKAFDD